MIADQEKSKPNTENSKSKIFEDEGNEAKRNMLDFPLCSFVSFVVKLLQISVNQW